MKISYSCSDYPGMESCPGHFVAESEDELMQLTELHARVAHGEDPAQWGTDDINAVKELFKSEG